MARLGDRRREPWRAAAWMALWLVLSACRQEPVPTRATPPSAASSASALPAPAEPFATRFAAPERLVAIGDLHGDLAATRAALELGRVLGDGERWIGGTTVVVQLGDVLDRGDDERAILALLERLEGEAATAGGRLHLLNGNHELMNVAGDLRYVTPGGFAEFASVPDLDLGAPALARAPASWRPRLAAFWPGGPYARKLAHHPLVLTVGRTLFAHGGVLSSHVRYGLERINQETRAWLRGESMRGRRFMARHDSPVWVRDFSGAPAEVDCDALAEMLAAANAARLVVGHTTQPQGITSACDGRVWRIDVGLATLYDGPLEVLEIAGDQVRALRGKRGDG